MLLRLLAVAAALLLAVVAIQPTLGRAQSDAELETLAKAKRQIDGIAAEPNDRRRIGRVQEFLGDFPSNYWRHMAYRLWLYSAWRLGDPTELQKTADIYLKEYPESGAAHGSVSRYFLEARHNMAQGMQSARRSHELYERELGVMTIEGLRSINTETRGLQQELDYLPPNRRGTFINYLGSRFNLARYELDAGQRNSALRQIEPIIELNPFTSEEEETIAPFYFVAGQAYESLNENAAAYRNYLGAVVVGDPHNRWASQAQSRLRTVGEALTESERAAAARNYIPAALRGMSLPRFTNITRPAGLTGVQASRVAWGDVDGDYDADLLLDGNKLYLNSSNGFVAAGSAWGLPEGERNAGLFADVNNDGLLDLYILGDGPRANRLLRNSGTSFSDITATAGSASVDADCVAGSWIDANGDGWIDLYLAGFGKFGAEVAADVLLENTGTGALRQASLVENTPAAGAGVSVADLLGDGRLDIYVANRTHPDVLWLNGEGGRFTDMADAWGLAVGPSIASVSSAADWADVDNNGTFDLFVARAVDNSSSARFARSAFYMHATTAGQPRFTDVREGKGIRGAGSLTEPLFADFNNDGFTDLFITSSGAGQRSYLYLNDGLGGWHDYTYLSGTRVFAGLGCAVADFDRDGDLDIAVCTQTGMRLLRNDSPPQQWLQVRCTGGTMDRRGGGFSNAAGIGARVTLTVGAETFTKLISSGKGSGCGNEMVAQFGLGERTGRMTLRVDWPSGRVTTRQLTAQNQRIEISETDEAEAPRPTVEQPPVVTPPSLQRPGGSR